MRPGTNGHDNELIAPPGPAKRRPAACCPAFAQEVFTSRPLRLIVGFTPGGATDISARAIAPKMGDALGQPVIVENRPGASSDIATEVVARSPADGHTLLLATLGALVVSPMVIRLPVDPARDLVPVSVANARAERRSSAKVISALDGLGAPGGAAASDQRSLQWRTKRPLLRFVAILWSLQQWPSQWAEVS